MGVVAKFTSKIGQMVKPIVKPVAKMATNVMSKVDANKPELMLYSGTAMVVVGTVWMIIATRKVDTVMEESSEAKEQLDAKKAEMTDKEFRKAFLKVRAEVVWKFIKLYGVPAVIWLLGICDMVGGHFVLKKRYILTTMTLKGMEEFIQFVKGNVIEDVGVDKWNEYAHGIVDTAPMEAHYKDSTGTEVGMLANCPICKPHENPWRIPFNEQLFKSWKPDTDLNFFFLQGVEKYWNENKYQADKDAEISIYQILDYLNIDWSKIDKTYRTWLRNQVWGHHIYGDDRISFGLHMPVNDPARRRQSDLIYMEFNAEGMPSEIINRYRDEAWLKSQKKNGRNKGA